MAGMRRQPPGFGAKGAPPPPSFVFGINLRETEGAAVDAPQDVWVSPFTPTQEYTNGLGHSLTVQFSQFGQFPEDNPRSVDTRLEGAYWYDNRYAQPATNWIYIRFTGAALVAGNWEISYAGGSPLFSGYEAGFILYDTFADMQADTNRLVVSTHVGTLDATQVLDASNNILTESTWVSSHVPAPFVNTTPGELYVAQINFNGVSQWVAARHFRLTKVS